MTVTELILRLQALPNQNALVHVPTPLPTEMRDCRVLDVVFDNRPEESWCVWIDWATDKCGSGMEIGASIHVTRSGLEIDYHG